MSAENAPSESTRTLANLIREYAEARKTTERGALFAYGAELALIDSLMLAKVSQAVDIATGEIRADREREANLAKCGDPEPWRSRRTFERGPSPEYFPESILTHGVDYRPRTLAEQEAVTA